MNNKTFLIIKVLEENPELFDTMFLKEIERYDEIITKNPNDAEAYLERADAKSWINDDEGACKDLKKAIELGNKEAIKIYKEKCEGR